MGKRVTRNNIKKMQRSDWRPTRRRDRLTPAIKKFLAAEMKKRYEGQRPTSQVEGLCRLHRRQGWTALAFWDRTGDNKLYYRLRPKVGEAFECRVDLRAFECKKGDLDITIAVLPEPGALALLLVGAVVAIRRRRR